MCPRSKRKVPQLLHPNKCLQSRKTTSQPSLRSIVGPPIHSGLQSKSVSTHPAWVLLLEKVKACLSSWQEEEEEEKEEEEKGEGKGERGESEED